MAEAPGILNWLVKGLLDYLEGGLQEPQSVLDATAEFRSESDPIGAFLTECTVVSGDASLFIRSRDLIDAVSFWQMEQAGAAWGNRTISNRLKEKADRWRHPSTGRVFSAGKSGDWGYRGIALTVDRSRPHFFRERSNRRI